VLEEVFLVLIKVCDLIEGHGRIQGNLSAVHLSFIRHESSEDHCLHLQLCFIALLARARRESGSYFTLEVTAEAIFVFRVGALIGGVLLHDVEHLKLVSREFETDEDGYLVELLLFLLVGSNNSIEGNLELVLLMFQVSVESRKDWVNAFAGLFWSSSLDQRLNRLLGQVLALSEAW